MEADDTLEFIEEMSQVGQASPARRAHCKAYIILIRSNERTEGYCTEPAADNHLRLCVEHFGQVQAQQSGEWSD